ncbi:MAG: gamma-glutamylcyclotransferase [Proteobacteria bacterium SW_6_67_9]|nr:MAG: gamma-glutamylcyclotransferase [Proteobacteria bacterium SW_6_67_9]
MTKASAAMPGRARHVFVYGTLLYPEVAAAVIGTSPAASRARLDGFGRYQVRHAPFPGIAPADSSVRGLVFEAIDAHALARIDDFEDDMYRRTMVRVVREHDGEAIDAEAYVVRPRWRPALRHRDWDRAAFERDWLPAYSHTGRGRRSA